MRDCVTPQCSIRRVCRDLTDPQNPLGLPPSSSACLPNSANLPLSNCARINLRFDLAKLPNVSVKIILYLTAIKEATTLHKKLRGEFYYIYLVRGRL